MSKITKLHHIGFIVKDIDESINFYTKLGFAFHDRWTETPEECAEGLGFPGASLELAQVVGYDCMVEFIQYLESGGSSEKAGANNRSVGHLAFEVDDINKIVIELQSQGIKFISKVIEHEFAPWVQFDDPDGIRLEFMELTRNE